MDTSSETKLSEMTPDEKIVQEAKDRFDECIEWEADFRKLFIEDLRFANGDSDNKYQWPDTTRDNREIDDRPCLTINKTKQHCLQIINDGRQHAPQIKVKPIEGGATVEAAKLIDGYVRHVEYRSHAQSAYNTSQEFAVFGGIGYCRVTTEYVNDSSFDQDIRIERVTDPMTVYLDPAIKEMDGSDAGFGFVFVDHKKDEFARKYGKKAAEEAQFPLSEEGGTTWLSKNKIRVCEYFRVQIKYEVIAALDAELVEALGLSTNIIKEKDVEPEVWKVILAAANEEDAKVRTRKAEKKQVQWFLIAGNKIRERRDWPGSYVPIARCAGEELIIDGKLERKGHTRTLKDPQRMYNYWTSSGVENVALQTKIPYIAAAEAISGYETYWDTANANNYSYLPFNSIDDQGNAIPMPSRVQPPVMANAYIEGMKIAASEMMMVSGQYQAVMGQQGNETSGVAIANRQRQGDNATYHFIDHQAAMVRFIGVLVVDLMPKVIDTPRLLRVLGEDGVEDFIHVDPEAKQAHVEKQIGMEKEAQQVLNPNIGTYDVVVDVGPAYATRRQEAFAAMSQIMAHNDELMSKAGDLLFKAADFPMAQDIAERLNRAIPPQLLGKGPDPQLQAAMEQIDKLHIALGAMTNSMAAMKGKDDAASQRADADTFRAETDRARFLHDAGMDSHQAIHDIAKAVTDMMHERKDQEFQQQQAIAATEAAANQPASAGSTSTNEGAAS